MTDQRFVLKAMTDYHTGNIWWAIVDTKGFYLPSVGNSLRKMTRRLDLMNSAPSPFEEKDFTDIMIEEAP